MQCSNKEKNVLFIDRLPRPYDTTSHSTTGKRPLLLNYKLIYIKEISKHLRHLERTTNTQPHDNETLQNKQLTLELTGQRTDH